MSKPSRLTAYNLYLIFISLAGVALATVGFWQITTYQPLAMFLLLLLLAVLAEIATTSVQVSDQSGITFDVGTSIGMAALPLFGPISAVLVVAAANLGIWLLKPSEKTTWKKNLSQLLFNNGMHAVAIFVAGLVFLILQTQLGAESWLGRTIPFVITAVIYDQANFWLLAIIIRLQHGNRVNPLALWRENVWAMPINVLVLAIGGGLLAFSAQQFGATGIAIFFLPIILSAYAFRLYVRQMQSHMANLEQIVAERTRELAQRSDELENVNREKDAFLAVLTHDMKTPLNSIGLYAELLEERPDVILEKPHLVKTIRRSQEALLNMVNNILDLEKLQAGEAMPLNKESFDLNLLTDYLLETMHVQASDKGVSLHYEPLKTGLLLYADQQQIERAITNVISNAIKYTPEGGHISINIHHYEQEAIIAISDNGYGIPEDELPFIFQRFRRVQKHKKLAVGTGLGLAVAKAIVEAHGGTIDVSSEEGVGSRFCLQFPL